LLPLIVAITQQVVVTRAGNFGVGRPFDPWVGGVLALAALGAIRQKGWFRGSRIPGSTQSVSAARRTSRRSPAGGTSSRQAGRNPVAVSPASAGL
jgi:hypothetical protein